MEAVKKRLTGNERKQQILKNAIELFSEKGFKSVSTNLIAKKCNINEALIFQHFKTKNELMNEVIIGVINKNTDFIREIGSSFTEKDFYEKLYFFEKLFIKMNTENPGYLKILLYAVLEEQPLPDKYDKQREIIFSKWLYECIEKGKKEWGFNKNLNTDVVISSFIGGLIYFILQKVIKMNMKIDVNKIEKQFVQIFIKSLK